MNTALDDCRDFARRVRRRLALARAARRVLLSLAISGGVAVLAMAILTIFARPALPAMLAIMPAGLLAGLAWALWHIPGTTAAARWIDRQLQLCDLLTTALTQGDFADPAWAQSVIAMAAQQCRRHKSSDVPVMSPPRWSAAVVAMEITLVLSLGLFFTPTGRGSLFAPARDSGDQWDSPNGLPRTLVSRSGKPPRRAGDSNLNESRNLGTVPNDVQATSNEGSKTTTPGQDSHPANANNNGESHTGGTGQAITTPQPAPTVPHDSTAPGSAKIGTTGTPGGGGHGAADSTASSSTSGNGTVSPEQTALFNGSDWPGAMAAEAADTAIRAGRVPAEDIDLVRDFFQPGQR